MGLGGKLLMVPLFLLAGLLTLYGLFVLIYNGDGGTTYVTLAGHRTNAHLVGAVSLLLGMALCAACLLGRRRS
jgi:hypothetical protein